MIKRSPSRNHRSKGIKVKHVLQIILLLGVCFWLIYHVKHSHDKKKEFDENDAEMSVGTQTAYQLPKLGRKDLHPGKDEVNQNEKDEEEVEDEKIVEDNENKHEQNEQEEGNEHETEEKEEGKHGVIRGGEEQEEDERGGANDEIDENDPEKSEVDTDRNEEFMDEEKKKEEEGDEKNENSEDEEKEGLVEENHNSHEAREEHYKGDDASSAVTHDTHTTSTEIETVGLENSDVNSEMSITNSENKPNYREESNRNQTGSDFKVTKVELTGGTSGKESGNNSLSNPVDSSHLNNTATAYSDSHSEASSNLTVVIPRAGNNMTGTGTNTSSEQNKMMIFSKSNQAPNDRVNRTVIGDVKNVQTEGLQQGGNIDTAAVPVKTKNGDTAAGESSNLESGELEKTTRFVASNEIENTETRETNKTHSNSSMKENADAIEDVKFKGKDATQTGETDETSDSSSGNGTSDSHILKVRTNLDTLPDTRNEGHNGDVTKLQHSKL